MSDVSGSPKSALHDPRETPAVFLMTNSFETGGSERQFKALAERLSPERFRVELGCIFPEGAFRQDLG